MVMSSLWLVLLLTGPWSDADVILGVWTTESGDEIEIYSCDEGYCAKIVTLVEPHYPEEDPMAGRAKVDRENPDEALRDRPILGLELMSVFTAKGNNRWTGGTIYDPENGKTYKCKITLEGEDRLKVRGYIGVSVIGRTTVWTR
jgi:uncharacterized protein (DUF2147 family)